MITLFDLWEKFIGKVNTHQGGAVRPNRNFVHWVNDISFGIFEEEYAVWEKTQVVSDRLMPFLRSLNIVVTPMPGQKWDLVKLPADYEHFSSGRIIRKNGQACGDPELVTVSGSDGCSAAVCTLYLDEDDKKLLEEQADENLKEVGIRKLKNNQWTSGLDHEFLAPSYDDPACCQFDKGLRLAPKKLGVIVLDYLRKPAKGTFAYTIINPGTETEYIQYDANNSTPLEWSETLINEFVNRLQKNYGTFVREQMVYEHGENDRRTSA